MAKIYTKTGDQGLTGLVGGARVKKSSPRIDAYGTVDELNSSLGLARSWMAGAPELSAVNDILDRLQNELFNLGSRLACNDEKMLKQLPPLEQKSISWMESHIDKFTEKLPALKNFILPGGHPVASQLHLARTICRRAERLSVGLQDQGETIETETVVYLNRLSDFLFVLARWVNHQTQNPETIWSNK